MQVLPRTEGEGAVVGGPQGSLSPDSKRRGDGVVSQKKKEKARREQKKGPEDREAGEKKIGGRKKQERKREISSIIAVAD